jgi:hypothetical protein
MPLHILGCALGTDDDTPRPNTWHAVIRFCGQKSLNPRRVLFDAQLESSVLWFYACGWQPSMSTSFIRWLPVYGNPSNRSVSPYDTISYRDSPAHQVTIARVEGLEKVQDMELLGTTLGSQLRHTPAQSHLDFVLHEESSPEHLCTIFTHSAHMVV